MYVTIGVMSWCYGAGRPGRPASHAQLFYEIHCVLSVCSDTASAMMWCVADRHAELIDATCGWLDRRGNNRYSGGGGGGSAGTCSTAGPARTHTHTHTHTAWECNDAVHGSVSSSSSSSVTTSFVCDVRAQTLRDRQLWDGKQLHRPCQHSSSQLLTYTIGELKVLV